MPRKMFRSSSRLLRAAQPYIWASVVVALFAASITEGVVACNHHRFTCAVAQAVVDQAGATTPREKVLALRDYLRREVRIPTRPGWLESQPLLRVSAAETLRSHEGYCGEGTRAFIVMADAVGIPAQRLNLYGPEQAHVVAEADLGPEGKVLVDCQQPPHIAELTPLDQVVGKSGFVDYSTLNLRRVGLGPYVPRLKLAMGPLTYWVERPHAVKSAFWAVLALGVPSFQAFRRLLRRLLLKRGWIHASNRDQIERFAQNPPAGQPKLRPEPPSTKKSLGR